VKKFIYLFISTLAIISCSSDDETEISNADLAGIWNWTASCGGFSGACSYPDNENYKLLQITNEKFTEKINGTVTVDTSYVITNTWISETNYPNEVNYKLTLEDGSVREMTLFKRLNKLTIGNNMFIEYYEGQ